MRSFIGRDVMHRTNRTFRWPSAKLYDVDLIEANLLFERVGQEYVPVIAGTVSEIRTSPSVPVSIEPCGAACAGAVRNH